MAMREVVLRRVSGWAGSIVFTSKSGRGKKKNGMRMMREKRMKRGREER